MHMSVKSGPSSAVCVCDASWRLCSERALQARVCYSGCCSTPWHKLKSIMRRTFEACCSELVGMELLGIAAVLVVVDCMTAIELLVTVYTTACCVSCYGVMSSSTAHFMPYPCSVHCKLPLSDLAVALSELCALPNLTRENCSAATTPPPFALE
jgi:hypothetical protein